MPPQYGPPPPPRSPPTRTPARPRSAQRPATTSPAGPPPTTTTSTCRTSAPPAPDSLITGLLALVQRRPPAPSGVTRNGTPGGATGKARSPLVVRAPPPQRKAQASDRCTHRAPHRRVARRLAGGAGTPYRHRGSLARQLVGIHAVHRERARESRLHRDAAAARGHEQRAEGLLRRHRHRRRRPRPA